MSGRVLLVDPHAGFRHAALGALRRRGYVCHALGAAREAADSIRRGAYDVLVLDVGSASTRRLLLGQPPPTLPVVAVTGRHSAAGALAAFRIRAVDYLTKPIRLPVLADSVHMALQKALAMRQVRRAERVITLCAEWVHLLDGILAAPGPALLPARLLAATTRERPWTTPVTLSWRDPPAVLSPREQQVLLAFGSGLRVLQIARALGVSIHTARAHLKAIMRKLNVHSQAALLEQLHAAEAEPIAAPGPPEEDSNEAR